MSEAKEPENGELNKLQLNVETAVKSAPQLIAEMQTSSEKAKAALSGITAITTDAEDEKAMLLLGKVKTTYEGINAKRMSITAPMDQIKSHLMQFEKVISPTDATSEYSRVKGVRDKYANDKFKEQQAKEAKALKDKAKNNEIARLQEVFVNRFHDGVVDAIAAMRGSIQNYFNSIKIETFDEQVKKFNLAPKLKQEVFESLFIVNYDKNLLPVEEFTVVLNKVKEQFKYEEINAFYVEKALPVLQEFKDRLPALKESLQAEADLATSNAEAAEKLKQEREKASQDLADAAKLKDDQEKAANAENAANATLAANLENEFVSQIEVQEGKTSIASNRKINVATITCEPKDTVIVLTKLIYQMLVDPTSPGMIKKDKEGKNIIDENGRPEYQPWVETLLTYHAEHSDVKIEGITITQVLSTITKRKSAKA